MLQVKLESTPKRVTELLAGMYVCVCAHMCVHGRGGVVLILDVQSVNLHILLTQKSKVTLLKRMKLVQKK